MPENIKQWQSISVSPLIKEGSKAKQRRDGGGGGGSGGGWWWWWWREQQHQQEQQQQVGHQKQEWKAENGRDGERNRG